jgi:mannose PTS system EIID component
MSPIPARIRRRVMLRSLLVQGSWNYETLIGAGFAFTIMPVLRHLYGADERAFRSAVERHIEVFNSNPFLATVAVGAVSRLEADGVEPRVISRFKGALRSSLGSLGDQLVWSAWRPAAVLLGVLLLLAGVVWWLAAMVFLVVFNALGFAVRIWGWRVGVESGMEVGRVIREAPLQPLARRATEIGSLIAGAALALAASSALNDPWTAAVNVLAIPAGIWLGFRMRRLLTAIIVIFVALGIATGIVT